MLQTALPVLLLAEDGSRSSMTDDNIRRLIQNQKSEHLRHAFAGNRGGMDDFNLLHPVLTKLPAPLLRKWMRLIDTMRATHEDCAPCYAKILAYSILFTQERAPELCERYRQIYTPFVAKYFVGSRHRDVMGEIQASIHGTEDKVDKLQPTNSRRSILELLALMKDDDEEYSPSSRVREDAPARKRNALGCRG